MTNKGQLEQMLMDAEVPFTTRAGVGGYDPVVEVDGGNGATALFNFNTEGTLMGFTIDKNAY